MAARLLSWLPCCANPPPANSPRGDSESNDSNAVPILSRATIPLWTGDARNIYYIYPAAVDGGPPAVNNRQLFSECFDGLLKLRESIDEEVEKARKEARTRGYYMMAGQIASGLALFLPFAKKNFNNGRKKGVGLLIYISFMAVIALLIWISLWRIIGQFKKLEKRWEDLLQESEEKLIGSGLICTKTVWGDKVDEEATEEGKKLLRLQDQAMLKKMKLICTAPDFGWMGSRLVLMEMVVATTAMIAIPITATYSRLS